MATPSCGEKGDVQELAAGLIVLETIGDDAQSKRLHASDSLVAATGLDGAKITIPDSELWRPKWEFLEWHEQEVSRG